MYIYTYRHACKYRQHMYVCVYVYILGPSGVLLNTGSCVRPTEKPNDTKTSESGAEKGLLQGHARRHRANAPKTKFFKIFQQSIFKERLGRGRWVRVMVGCCKLLGIAICSCSCPARSGNDVPVNFQRDKCSATFYLYMNGKVLYI